MLGTQMVERWKFRYNGFGHFNSVFLVSMVICCCFPFERFFWRFFGVQRTFSGSNVTMNCAFTLTYQQKPTYCSII